MSNTFVKMMNNSVTSNYNSSVINDIQKDLHIQTKALGQQLYNDIKATYMPEATQEQWEKCLRKYADKVARTKMMLNV